MISAKEYVYVRGYEGLYIINRYGTVLSVKNNTIKLLRSSNQHGYRAISLAIDGKRKAKRIHRLIAEAFIPNPESKPFINHIDGNKSNNEIKNLEWVTHQENMRHAVLSGARRCLTYDINVLMHGVPTASDLTVDKLNNRAPKNTERFKGAK